MLLRDCAPLLSDLRQLNTLRFKESPFIRGALDELETGIRAVAALGQGKLQAGPAESLEKCPHCRAPVTRIGYPRPTTPVCPTCPELFMPALGRLDALEGFGTCSI